METIITTKSLIEKNLNNYKLNEETKSVIEKICNQSYVQGFRQGRFEEQMSFIQQANFQLEIIKKLKEYLKNNKEFKILNYVEQLERERQ